MNVRQALDMLGSRLEDRDTNKYSDEVKLEFLSNAEVQLAQMLNDAYLTELETLEASVSLSSGKVLISSLANRVLRGGQGIKDVQLSSGLVCRRMDPQKRGELRNSYWSSKPTYWTFNGYLYVNPSTETSVAVSYLKMPPILVHNFTYAALGSPSTTGFIGADNQSLSSTSSTYNGLPIYCREKSAYFVITNYVGSTRTFTVSPAATGNFGAGSNLQFYFYTSPQTLTNIDVVEFSLNPSLHEIILLLAEASARAMTNEVERRNSAQQKAFDMIAALNARYEAPDGIGTNTSNQ